MNKETMAAKILPLFEKEIGELKEYIKDTLIDSLNLKYDPYKPGADDWLNTINKEREITNDRVILGLGSTRILDKDIRHFLQPRFEKRRQKLKKQGIHFSKVMGGKAIHNLIEIMRLFGKSNPLGMFLSKPIAELSYRLSKAEMGRGIISDTEQHAIMGETEEELLAKLALLQGRVKKGGIIIIPGSGKKKR